MDFLPVQLQAQSTRIVANGSFVSIVNASSGLSETLGRGPSGSVCISVLELRPLISVWVRGGMMYLCICRRTEVESMGGLLVAPATYFAELFDSQHKVARITMDVDDQFFSH
jgi:hypothetical protein